MESYKVMEEALGERSSIIPEVAHRIGRKPSTVSRWKLPYEHPEDGDRGSRSPLDTLKFFMEACLSLGRPREAALAPLRHLNNHFNQICFTIPENIKALSPVDLNKALIRCMKEFGDVVAVWEKSMKNDRISKKERAEIEREVWETVTELMTLMYCVKECAK